MADKFIIDPKSVSYLEIRQDVIDYFNSLPNAGEWQIFLSSEAGQRIIDLVATLAAFNKLDSITARREGFLQFAQNRSSMIGKAQDLGYSTYRGRNKVIKITFTPLSSGVITKYTNLGSVKDRFLVLESDTVVNAGVPISVNVIVGEVKEEVIFANSSALNSFRFRSPDVSEDLRMYIDNTEVAWGIDVQDALNNKFQIQSNTFRSVDAKYLNQPSAPTQYIIGSEIKLQYIELKDIQYTNTDIKFYDSIGTMTAIEDISLFNPVESEVSIKINAPIKHETGNAVRGREDQRKIYRSLHPDILDAQGIDIIDAIVKIFVLRSGGLAFTAAEFQAMQDAFESYRPNGLRPPFVENATSASIKLKIDLKLRPTSTTQPEVLVDSVIEQYLNKLGASLSLVDIEDQLENDEGVRIGRASVIADAWAASTSFKKGDYREPSVENGFVYRVKDVRSKSGLTEPTWPLVAGNTVVDNQIVWKAKAQNDLAGISNWAASTFYTKADIIGFNLGSIVKPTVANGFVYEAVDYVFASGSVEPTWSSTAGDKISDNRLLWVVRPLLGTPSAWQASTSYKLGDVVKATTGFTAVMFQVIALTDSSGSVEPTWPLVAGSVVGDENLLWEAQSKSQDIHSVDKDQHFIIDYDLTVT